MAENIKDFLTEMKRGLNERVNAYDYPVSKETAEYIDELEKFAAFVIVASENTRILERNASRGDEQHQELITIPREWWPASVPEPQLAISDAAEKPGAPEGGAYRLSQGDLTESSTVAVQPRGASGAYRLSQRDISESSAVFTAKEATRGAYRLYQSDLTENVTVFKTKEKEEPSAAEGMLERRDRTAALSPGVWKRRDWLNSDVFRQLRQDWTRYNQLLESVRRDRES